MTGGPDRALELGQRASVLSTAHHDVSLQAVATPRLGVIWQTTGDYRQAAECLTQTVEALQGDRRYERYETGTITSVLALDRLAWCLAELGEFAEAIA
jgi:Tetratricopeptide repeat